METNWDRAINELLAAIRHAGHYPQLLEYNDSDTAEDIVFTMLTPLGGEMEVYVSVSIITTLGVQTR